MANGISDPPTPLGVGRRFAREHVGMLVDACAYVPWEPMDMDSAAQVMQVSNKLSYDVENGGHVAT